MEIEKKEAKRRMKEKQKQIVDDFDKKNKEIENNAILSEKEKKALLKENLEKTSKDIKDIETRYKNDYIDASYKKPRLIFFFVLVLLTVFSIFYNLNQSGKFLKYNNFEHVSDTTIFKKKEDKYYVYLYGEKCSACNHIKKDALKYCKTGKVKMYLFNCTIHPDIAGDNTTCMGAKKYEELKVSSTPTLLLIENGVCTFVTSGTDSILEKLYKNK